MHAWTCWQLASEHCGEAQDDERPGENEGRNKAGQRQPDDPEAVDEPFPFRKGRNTLLPQYLAHNSPGDRRPGPLSEREETAVTYDVDYPRMPPGRAIYAL